MVDKGLPIRPMASTADTYILAARRRLGATPVVQNSPQLFNSYPGSSKGTANAYMPGKVRPLESIPAIPSLLAIDPHIPASR